MCRDLTILDSISNINLRATDTPTPQVAHIRHTNKTQ